MESSQVGDGHCHLSFLSDEKLDQLFLFPKEGSSEIFIQGGYDVQDWQRQIELSRRYPESHIRTCFGIHPWVINKMKKNEREIAWLKLLEMSPQASLIGETGLDCPTSSDLEMRQVQIDFFIRHIQLSCALKRPLVLHIVQAHGQCLKILQDHGHLKPFGIVHSFSGSQEVAQQYVDLGFFISIGPNLLKKGFKKLRESVMHIDLRYLIIESDTPALALPVKQRTYDGKIILEIASAIGQIKKISTSQVLNQQVKNLQSLSEIRPV